MAARKKKKTEDKPLTRAEKIQLLRGSIKEKFKGRALLTTGSDFEAPYMVVRLPTRLIGMDLALGGGFPAGGLSEIIGPESSAKTTLLNRIFSVQQSIHGKDAALAVAMTEHRYDKLHARNNCDVSVAMAKAEIASAEQTMRRKFTDAEIKAMRTQIGELDELTGDTIEKLYESVLEVVGSNLFQVVGIDSWGNFLTNDMADGDMEDRTYAGAAGVNTLFCNKLAPLFTMPDDNGDMNYTAIIGINHYRAKIAGANAKASKMGNMNIQGGHALKHLKLVSLYLESKPTWAKIGGRNRKVGRTVKWEVIKGKAGCSDGGKGEFNIVYGKGIDAEAANIVTALEWGLVKQSGTWLSIIDPEDGAELIKAQGVGNLADKLREDPELHLHICEQTLRFAAEQEDTHIVTTYKRP